jgi:hypothetical protein
MLLFEVSLRTALIFNRTSHRVIALRGAACALPRERFSRVLGMFSSLEVKVLYPT